MTKTIKITAEELLRKYLNKKITWKESYDLYIGVDRCCACGKATPPPTHAQMLEHAQNNQGEYMHVGDQKGDYMPVGWTVEYDEEIGGGGALCPGCTKRKRAALTSGGNHGSKRKSS